MTSLFDQCPVAGFVLPGVPITQSEAVGGYEGLPGRQGTGEREGAVVPHVGDDDLGHGVLQGTVTP